MRIRSVSAADTAELLAIYAPYVLHTAITFEYDVPSEEEFRERIEHVRERYPYLAAEENGELLGYAYLSAFHPRAAYSRCAETSIYLREDKRGRGIGRALYSALEDAAREMHLLNLEACIGVPSREDEFLTLNSVRFHEHMGYRMVGEFKSCGYKFGRWYDMCWMEKHIGEHPAQPLPVEVFHG